MHKLARFTALVSFVLVIAGGLVTSTGSGLAVPDWPLSYGSFFPPMVGGILYEHSHRMIATAVGLLTLALTLGLLFKERRTGVRRFGILCFGLVVFQGILGGLTVLWLLPLPVSVAHATMGQTFFTAIVLLATVLSPQWSASSGGWQIRPEDRGLTRASLAALAAVYAQLVMGAALRHAGWRPALVAAHLAGAGAAVFFCLRAARGVLESGPAELSGAARRIQWLVAAQLVLGAATFFLGRPVPLATAHVAVGALLLASTAVLALKLYQSKGAGSTWHFLGEAPAYLELAKPRLTALAVLTTLAGFFMASSGAWNWGAFLSAFAGSALVGAGAAALNQVMERDLDAKMERTMDRPLPSGRLSTESGLAFGVACSAAGLFLLAAGANPLAGALGALTLITYLFIYTPLKTRSALCTLAGAVPGALPPLIGWAAAAGRLELGAWLLFSILFLWQLPHFLALAWKYKADYARAGFKMLPVLDPDGGITFRQMVLYTLALLPVSILPTALGLAGGVYFFVALAAGLAFLGFGLATAALRSDGAATRLFFCSIVYLPCILATLTLEKAIL